MGRIATVIYNILQWPVFISKECVINCTLKSRDKISIFEWSRIGHCHYALLCFIQLFKGEIPCNKISKFVLHSICISHSCLLGGPLIWFGVLRSPVPYWISLPILLFCGVLAAITKNNTLQGGPDGNGSALLGEFNQAWCLWLRIFYQEGMPSLN